MGATVWIKEIHQESPRPRRALAPSDWSRRLCCHAPSPAVIGPGCCLLRLVLWAAESRGCSSSLLFRARSGGGRAAERSGTERVLLCIRGAKQQQFLHNRRRPGSSCAAHGSHPRGGKDSALFFVSLLPDRNFHICAFH